MANTAITTKEVAKTFIFNWKFKSRKTFCSDEFHHCSNETLVGIYRNIPGKEEKEEKEEEDEEV